MTYYFSNADGHSAEEIANGAMGVLGAMLQGEGPHAVYRDWRSQFDADLGPVTTVVTSDPPAEGPPIACKVVAGTEHLYDVHQHALGSINMSTGVWSGDRYCVAIKAEDVHELEFDVRWERKVRRLRQIALDAGHDALPSFLFRFQGTDVEPRPEDFGPASWGRGGTCYPGCAACEAIDVL
jgi:hypothetical protein